ncbi:hypothetical protein FXO37_08393 [Capsicum annuum]|nr:hypothetical protein FXO37_08393 [Capsicum annuum]
MQMALRHHGHRAPCTNDLEAKWALVHQEPITPRHHGYQCTKAPVAPRHHGHWCTNVSWAMGAVHYAPIAPRHHRNRCTKEPHSIVTVYQWHQVTMGTMSNMRTDALRHHAPSARMHQGCIQGSIGTMDTMAPRHPKLGTMCLEPVRPCTHL